MVDAIGRHLGEISPTATISRWDRSVPLAESVADVDVILPSNAGTPAAVIAAAPRLRLIQQPAAGVDGIDLDAARARGIPVCNAPGANHIAVAEATLLLILSLARRVPLARGAFARGEIGVPLGFELAGKTLGIVGLGQSGNALAERARALGMNVIGLRSSSVASDRRAFYAAADIVSLHCPLTPETRGLIDGEVFAAMKPGACLVNCARGAIIDRDALRAALASGRLGGVGLDVYWDEPWDPADPIFADPVVVTLPHVAGSTAESFDRISAIVVDNCIRLGRGQPLRHRVA
jgi:phosphoglycerate dehydrogenase-like enzyme